MIKEILRAVLGIILAIIVFYIAFTWTSACRLEKQYQREMMEMENGR